jgi:uncharacterized repeat protein (TIGR01451 family)
MEVEMSNKLAGALSACAAVALLIGYVGVNVSAQPAPRDRRPSKVAYIVQERAQRTAETLKRPEFKGRLSLRAAEALSDRLLRVSGRGEILVEFHGTQAVGPEQVKAIEALGGRVVTSTADVPWPKGMQPPAGLGIIVAWMPHDKIEDAAAFAWVAAVTPVEDNPPDQGAFLSEGVALHRADDLQGLGIDGTGVTVGAISDGVDSLAAAQGSGDLPATVTVPGGCPAGAGSGDEGTAMLEIVHDMAPAATLLFCGTGGGVASHVLAQNTLVAAGAQVITEDIPFDSEPAFQKGLAAVNGDAIAAAGVSMHSSAGNQAGRHAARVLATGTGNGPDGQAGPFAGCPLTPDNVVAIAPGNDTTFDVQVQPGTGGTTLSVTLQWSEPRAIFPTAGAGGFTDLNLYVMNAALTQCLGASVGVQAGGAGDTIEQISIPFAAGPNVNVKLVVDVQSAPAGIATPTIDLRWRGAGAVDASTRAGSLNPDSNYTGPATSAAAANAGGSTDPTTVGLEGFSSGGPVQLLLTTVCPGAYPCPGGAVGGPAAQIVGAPDWTAADGVSVSGAGGFGAGTCPAVNQGDCQFFGTSAATPHAAACDALVRSNNPGITVAGVTARLAASATDRGDAGFDNSWGWGVIDCVRAAIQADLAVTKSDSPDPVAAGTQVTYTLTVTNNGPNDTPSFEVTDTLPPATSFVSASAGCAETAPGSKVVTCAGGSLANGSSTAFSIVALVAADTVYNAGGPTTITNSATVTGVGLDPVSANDTASANTQVVAVADLEVVSATLVNPPAELLVGETATVTLKTVSSNRGPSAPMDARLDYSATAGAGSTVSPAAATETLLALGLDELREVTEDFTIGCTAAGQPTFTFTSQIEPVNAADTDPNLSNNARSAQLQVECVVPVAINIKPKSFPNSINPFDSGLTPVAVLTTKAGEYGLPLDFDATRIVATSVRFGPRVPVWSETGGAFDSDGKGARERSYELDEKTRDRDLDMVLHFVTQLTGIQPGEVEACAKGQFVIGGNTYKFFGCDSVRTAPPY